MKLIDVDALCTNPGNVRKVTEYDEAGYAVDYNAVPLKAILDAPAVLTIDLATTAPVARAEWMLKSVRSNFRRLPVWELMTCTACAGVVERYIGMLNYKYCPFCGAKMDKED